MTPYLAMTAGADGCLVSEALLRKIGTKVGPRMGHVPQEQSAGRPARELYSSPSHFRL